MTEIYDTFGLHSLQNTGKVLIASSFMRLTTFEKQTLLILWSCYNPFRFVFLRENMLWRLSVLKMIVHESEDEATMLFWLLGVSHLARQL